jgi:hypothetical protein
VIGIWGAPVSGGSGASDDDVKQAIANKVIELAKAGERNPDI